MKLTFAYSSDESALTKTNNPYNNGNVIQTLININEKVSDNLHICETTIPAITTTLTPKVHIRAALSPNAMGNVFLP